MNEKNHKQKNIKKKKEKNGSFLKRDKNSKQCKNKKINKQ